MKAKDFVSYVCVVALVCFLCSSAFAGGHVAVQAAPPVVVQAAPQVPCCVPTPVAVQSYVAPTPVYVQAAPVQSVAVQAVPQVAVQAAPVTATARVGLFQRLKAGRQARVSLRNVQVQTVQTQAVATVAPVCVGCSQ